MSANYQLTSAAEQDLDDIWDYVVEEFGEVVADGVIDDLQQAFRLLGEHPGIGRTRPELAGPPWMIWPVGPSLIAYRSDVTPIQIARVVRAERDSRGVELEKV